MKLEFEIAQQTYQVDTTRGIDIAIPLDFRGEQPNAYGVPRASAEAYRDGNFVGDTREGGSCNFETYNLIPHCNGTHTECVGHLTFERISIESTLRTSLLTATLISLAPVPALDAADTCRHEKEEHDRLITRATLAAALKETPAGFLDALVLRTLPNPDSKKTRQYAQEPAPYFSVEAMQLIVELQVQHLLVDMPSVDRAFDEGKLTGHHLFWDVPEGSHEVDKNDYSMRTITELIYVPDEVRDGAYLLDLQIPSFVADAAPSRPILYPMKEMHQK